MEFLTATVAIAVMDFGFSRDHGSVVGEKITRTLNMARPALRGRDCCCRRRAYEGMLSLMQMAKQAARFAQHAQGTALYISVLTNPTTAGVGEPASLGDGIIANPKA
jgi:acetyl-CoA carboxylase carboxyl transferase subunit beta